MVHHPDKSTEYVFQNEIVAHLKANGWLVGTATKYNRELALYTEDTLAFVKESQPDQWEKYCGIYPTNTEAKFLERVASQLSKVDPNAASKELRTYGTLGVLRHEIKDRGARFSLVQFKPEHDLNPDTLARYGMNRLRVVPELVYSPWATDKHLAETGVRARSYRIDLVLFVNGLPVVTMELKSEFKQAFNNAVEQYKKTRLPVDAETRKAEPLLTFKRGALVHFAVSQFEVWMATRLDGEETFFLPFNKGKADGGKGNDVPEDGSDPTSYLWSEVLLPDNLLHILQRFIHLEIKDIEDGEGRKSKKEIMIFPRYHQWDVVNKLISSARIEGPGQSYLIQHSAGSGKSNSIAWTAHQLSSLYDEKGGKQFHSVIIVTDRTVLDEQLQETIYQLEHVDGVVGRINKKEGEGSKSDKLATALEHSKPIIIVTIQTFPHVLKAIEDSVSLKDRNYAIIADEAHSSQTGSTARKLKEVLMKDSSEAASDSDEDQSADDVLNEIIASRRASTNLSYFAFTATPKAKTIELFGRCPDPTEPPSSTNKPESFHVYSMRQAIEEGFILDVLKNYTSYKVAYQLALKMEEIDKEVDSKKAKVKLNQWVRLHDYNISQKVQVIIEHFKDNVMHLLAGQAKAMVVTGSRKEAVRYKLSFDRYIAEKGYHNIHAMAAFSGEVEFTEKDPDAGALLGEKFTEANMNPNLKGRKMRKAFDTQDYQLMIVANKFQTGFDQPKLCAMYVDKKLGGVECVQTLSRLNRTYAGKMVSGTFVLDFFNDPDDVLTAFQPYYQIAELTDVSDPQMVHDLSEKLRSDTIFQWAEVEQFCKAFYQKGKSENAVASICKPAVDRWSKRYELAIDAYKVSLDMMERTRKSGDAVLIGNADTRLKDCRKEKDALEIFKKDLGTFVRFYEFISQIVPFDDLELEKLSLFARKLRPMLRETSVAEDDVDVDNVVLSHYRLSKIKQQNLKLAEDAEGYGLEPGEGAGSAKAKDPKEEFLSQIVTRLNEIFLMDELSEEDLISFNDMTRRKLSENSQIMTQLTSNSKEQALLGDFPKALIDAVLDSDESREKIKMQLLSSPEKQLAYASVMYDLLMSSSNPVASARSTPRNS